MVIAKAGDNNSPIHFGEWKDTGQKDEKGRELVTTDVKIGEKIYKLTIGLPDQFAKGKDPTEFVKGIFNEQIESQIKSLATAPTGVALEINPIDSSTAESVKLLGNQEANAAKAAMKSIDKSVKDQIVSDFKKTAMEIEIVVASKIQDLGGRTEILTAEKPEDVAPKKLSLEIYEKAEKPSEVSNKYDGNESLLDAIRRPKQ